MPFYQCICRDDLLTDDQRAELAEQITAIHCAATGAPRGFINVLFHGWSQGRFFSGGKPSRRSVLVGQIRAGRDVETRRRMLSDYTQMWTRVTGQPAGELLVILWENASENTMEAGLVLPQPGQEQDWFDANHDTLVRLGML